MREMTVRGYAERTKQSYLHDVELMVRRIGLHPSQITRDRAAQYFEWLVTEQKVSPSTYRQHLTAVSLFFRTVLKQDWTLFTEARPQKRRKLPTVLRLEEVLRLIRHIRLPRHRVAATVLYSCGLRISELLRMESGWIVQGGRRLHISAGKGGTDRLVPLPEKTLDLLREHWRREKPAGPLLFPSRYSPSRPACPDSLRRPIHIAATEAGIRHKVTAHTLRHCYATHLLELGVDVRLIQKFLGHRNLETTTVYTHLTAPSFQRAQEALERMTRDL